MSAVRVPSGVDEGLTWHYGDPTAEQRALASGRGVVDLSNRGVVVIEGPDRLTWLHNLTSQVFTGLQPGEATTAYVLDAQGHIRFVMHAVESGDRTWIWTEPGMAAGLASFLDSMRFMLRVEVSVREDVAVVWRAGDPGGDDRIVRVGRDSLGGHEAFVPRTVLASRLAEGEPVGTWAFDALRIGVGVPRIGVDTDDVTIPNELGVPSPAVALDKGCYPGQETVARIHNLGRPPRRLVRLLLDGSGSELPTVGDAVFLREAPEGRPVGFVGSSARHHESGPIALAMVKRSVPVDADLVVSGIAASQEALVDPEAGIHFRPRR